MLEQTIRRARLLIPSERLVVIGTAHHHPHIFQSLGHSPPGTVLLQPTNRDTAPGILLPLIHILRKDPHALVAILPSDHFVLPSRRFMRAVADAAEYVRSVKVDAPILLAVQPAWPEPEYGWIEPGKVVGYHDQQTILGINQFIEKPSRERAELLMRDGWFWNTMVIIVRAAALMGLARKHLPDLTARFTHLQRFLGTIREYTLTNEIYRAIPKVNFSASLLAGLDVPSLVLPVQNVRWSDWGTKERILDTITELGLSWTTSIRERHNGLSISA
jgi:mannose-1-phosphate guanylyltransferase